MRYTFLAATVLSLPAMAQIQEIPTMTVGASILDFDATSLGPAGVPGGTLATSLAALRAAGTGGGAPITAITMTASSAPNGVYNTNLPFAGETDPPGINSSGPNPPINLGRALGWNAANPSAPLLLINALATYSAYNCRIDLDAPVTQFGISIGDWLGSMVLTFRYQGSPVGSILTSRYDTSAPKFFSAPGFFDSVQISADPLYPSANWVIPRLYLENDGSWFPFGTGCQGTAGIPLMTLVSPPVIGQTYTFTVTNFPSPNGAYVEVMGVSNTTIPGVGNLPLDLGPFGAPSCFVLCDLASTQFRVANNGVGTCSLGIPFVHPFAGYTFFNQVYVLDPAANALGIVVSAGARVIVQDAP
jgi:hypothetical protein